MVVRNILENAVTAVQSAGGGRIELTRARRQRRGRAVGEGQRRRLPARRRGAPVRELHAPAPARGGSYYGTGLGLFIVRRLMQLARGRVRALSDGVGKGANFVLTWPAAAREPQP